MCPIDALYARQSLDKKDSISIENQIEFCKYETRGAEYETYNGLSFISLTVSVVLFSIFPI